MEGRAWQAGHSTDRIRLPMSRLLRDVPLVSARGGGWCDVIDEIRITKLYSQSGTHMA